MSSTPQAPGRQANSENRRLHPRRRIEQLTYAAFGPGNGGILINLSENGLAFQGIGVVRKGELIPLSFSLPGSGARIEAHGEVVWSNNSGKGGGLHFVDLSEETRQKLREWLASDIPASPNYVRVTPPRRPAVSPPPATPSRPASTSPAPPQPAVIPPASASQSVITLPDLPSRPAMSPPASPSRPTVAAPPLQEAQAFQKAQAPAPVATGNKPESPRVDSRPPAAQPATPQRPTVDELRRSLLSPDPEEAALSSFGATRSKTPSFILAEYPESQNKLSLPKNTLFIIGALAGCIGVLAAVLGLRMLTMPERPAIPAETSQSSATAPPSNVTSGSSSAGRSVRDETQFTSRNSGNDATETASERFFHKNPPQDVAAIGPALHSDSKVKPPKDSRQKTDLSEQRNLALLGRSLPTPHAGAEFQKPRSEPAPPTFSPAEVPRTNAPITPALPKLPQPPAEKSADKIDPANAAQPPVEKADSTPSEQPAEKANPPKQPEPPPTKGNPATGFTEAVLIQHDPPEYPASAIKKHIGGRVTVNATVGTDGVPRNLKLVMGDPTLGQAAEEAIVHWRYVPAVSGGVPVESQVAITINFQTRE